MNKRQFLYLILLIGGCLLEACGHDEKTSQPIAAAAKKPAVMEPFKFHKLIEVSPGQDFDVLSWGGGSASVGSFIILHSDSSGKKYTTTTGDLNGTIIDVYNSDMDLDGNPEILIEAKSKDTTNYATIYAFEFNSNTAHKLDFPKLTSSQRKGYRGGDNFYIKEGKFMREFPVYDGNGRDAKLTGQKRQLEYGLRNNDLTVKQLTKDSTIVKKENKAVSKPTESIKKEPVKTEVKEKKHTSSKKKKSHTRHEKRKHKKKHHRRHHRNSDD